MKTDFKDATAIKSQKPTERPKDGKGSPWNFEAPNYDQRSSCFVNAGTHYGIGHKQPIGSESHKAKSAIPMGRVETMRIDEKG